MTSNYTIAIDGKQVVEVAHKVNTKSHPNFGWWEQRLFRCRSGEGGYRVTHGTHRSVDQSSPVEYLGKVEFAKASLIMTS